MSSIEDKMNAIEDKISDFVEAHPVASLLGAAFSIFAGGYAFAQFVNYVGPMFDEHEQKRIEFRVPNEKPPTLHL